MHESFVMWRVRSKLVWRLRQDLALTAVSLIDGIQMKE
jgi:hypothetical protein